MPIKIPIDPLTGTLSFPFLVEFAFLLLSFCVAMTAVSKNINLLCLVPQQQSLLGVLRFIIKFNFCFEITARSAKTINRAVT